MDSLRRALKHTSGKRLHSDSLTLAAQALPPDWLPRPRSTSALRVLRPSGPPLPAGSGRGRRPVVSPSWLNREERALPVRGALRLRREEAKRASYKRICKTRDVGRGAASGYVLPDLMTPPGRFRAIHSTPFDSTPPTPPDPIPTPGNRASARGGEGDGRRTAAATRRGGSVPRVRF